jgi:hypothetical protein
MSLRDRPSLRAASAGTRVVVKHDREIHGVVDGAAITFSAYRIE